MSSLGNGLGKLFGGDGGSFHDQLTALKREHGTVTALARHLGVDRRTIQRWETGKIRAPKPEHREDVGRQYREAKVRTRKIPGDSDVTVSFKQRKPGGGTRSRTVTGDRLDLADGTMDQARRAYVAGGKEAAAKEFVDGIGDDWYHDVFEEDLTGEGEGTDDSQSDPTPAGVSVR